MSKFIAGFTSSISSHSFCALFLDHGCLLCARWIQSAGTNSIASLFLLILNNQWDSINNSSSKEQLEGALEQRLSYSIRSGARPLIHPILSLKKLMCKKIQDKKIKGKKVLKILHLVQSVCLEIRNSMHYWTINEEGNIQNEISKYKVWSVKIQAKKIKGKKV